MCVECDTVLTQDGEKGLELSSEEVVATLVDGRLDITLFVADLEVFVQHIGGEVANTELDKSVLCDQRVLPC